MLHQRGPQPFTSVLLHSPSYTLLLRGARSIPQLPRETGSIASLEVCPALSEEQAIWIMIISPLAPAISRFKHLFFLVMQWPGMFMLKQSDLACGAGIGGDGIQVWEAWGTSSLTMGFTDILKKLIFLMF